jgi:hypothetical protein
MQACIFASTAREDYDNDRNDDDNNAAAVGEGGPGGSELALIGTDALAAVFPRWAGAPVAL